MAEEFSQKENVTIQPEKNFKEQLRVETPSIDYPYEEYTEEHWRLFNSQFRTKKASGKGDRA